jgi:FG-GAP-like repeat
VLLSLPLGSNPASSFAVGDFNGDGRGDLALDEARDGANLRLYLQDSLGNLAPSIDIARERGSSSESLIAADLNRDGRTDLAIAHSGWGYIGYYLQAGGALTPETVVNAFQFQGRLNYFAAGDLNHDGCGDLVVARTSQSPVLLYGQGCVRPRISDCRYPAAVVPGLPSPLVGQHNGNVGANLRAGLTRGAAARVGRHGHGVRDIPPPNRAGIPVLDP